MKKFLHLTIIVIISLNFSGCFCQGINFAKERKLRDPDGYERDRRENRKWLEKDADKHGYELPPYEPNAL